MVKIKKNENKEYSELKWDVKEANTLCICLSGKWKISSPLPSLQELFTFLNNNKNLTKITFDITSLKDWDSSLITFLLRLYHYAREHKVNIDCETFPQGVLGLIKLTQSTRMAHPVGQRKKEMSFFPSFRQTAINVSKSFTSSIQFLGEITFAFGALFQGKAKFQGRDILLLFQETGPQALPIVSLISILVGLVLAFVGSVQLRMFGVEIYVANLVGLGMTMEMGAMMTAIILVGRAGASFAAELGAMEINEEIDAFKTLGISPVEFLVLPRVIVLVVMMPLLCLYADFMGIFGGMLVSTFLLDINPQQYLLQTSKAVGLNSFAMGIIKSTVFGVLIAFFGCLRGLNCGRSSSSVGQATTSAVVSGIIAIVVADALMTIIFHVVGF